jgi:prepilin-type N-terminal cleavage/methylation domain-containing protein
MERDRRRAGFTLVELLVVVSIIVIMATMSVYLIGGFFKGSSVKEGGRIVSAAFARARQQASTTRKVHFLVFNMSDSIMRLHEDTNRNFATVRTMEGPSLDKQSGEVMALPLNVAFDKVFGASSGGPYAAFQPDGSVTFFLPSGAEAPDQTGLGPTDADIVLRVGPQDSPAAKIFIDITPVTGLVRRMEFLNLK